MRRLVLRTCCLLVLAVGVRAQATWNFSANTGAPATLPANVNGGTITATNSTIAFVNTSVSSGYVGATGGNNASVTCAAGALSTSTSTYFQFTLTASANHVLAVTSLALGTRSNATGPTTLTLYSSADNFTNAIATATVSANSNWALVTLPGFSVASTSSGSLTFRLFGSGGTGSASSSNWFIDDLALGITVMPPPSISTAPTSQTVTSGQTASFSVAATGTGALSYQWFKSNVAIDSTANPSAATATLNLGVVTTVDSGGSYKVVVTDSVGSTTSNTATLTVGKIATTLAFSILTPTYDGAPHAATVTPSPASGVTTSVTYFGTGGTTAPVNAGTYTVNVAITDTEHVASGATTATLTITPAAVSIALSGLAYTYDGAAHAASATPTPSSVALSVTYTGTGSTTYGPTATAPTNAGTYSVAAASVDANYTGTATGTLTISPAAATITLGGLTATYDGAAHAVTATTTPAGLPVNLAYAGSPTAPTNAGTYAIVATVVATNFAGTDNTHSLVIAQAAQTVTFGALAASPAVGAPFTVSATASSGLTPVTFAIVSGSATATGATGSTITLGNTSPVTIRATAPVDLNHAAATADLTLSAGQLPQTITFAALPPRVTTEAIFFLNATASSGLPITYSIVSGPASITAGFTVILNGAAGTVVVRASQAGNASYLPAGSVDQSFDVSTPPAAPAITTQPASQTAAVGGTAAFTVVATGSPAPTYQWRKAGTPIIGANLATLSITSVALTDAGDYDVIVTNSGGSIASAIAMLSVPVAPSITTQPANVSASFGTQATLSVVATGTPAPTYQWRLASTAITGATNATLTFPAVALTDAGSYDVVVANSLGSVTSSAATLTVTKTAQTITFAAPTASFPAGSSITLSATASSGLPISFALVSGSASVSGGTLIGNSPTVVVRALQAGNATYDAAPTVDQTFTFFTGGVAPFLLTMPFDQTVLAGAAVTFTAAAIGTPTPTWQWQKDGAAISGATSATLTFPAVALTDAARYTVTATNPVGTVTASATLVVRSAPVISTPPASQTVFAGANVTFSVTAGAYPAATYQWRRNGAAISGATAATLAFASVRTTDAGSYDVVITNSLGATTSAAAQLTVNVHDFSGEYFGRFNGAAGDFALHVRADGTAAFLGYLPSLGTGFATLDLVVDSSGNFSVGLTTAASISGPSPLASDLSPAIAAAPRTITLHGSLNDTTGTVTGSVPELAVMLDGTRAPSTGTAAASAGFYQGALVGTAAGRGYVIVGADGSAFFFTVNGTSVDGAKTTLNSTGHLAVTTAAQTNVNLGFANGALTGTVGTATLNGASDALAGTEHLVNLSVRAPTGPGAATLITGFVVTGTTPKQVLIRAAGPAIAAAPFNVAGALADPSLQVFRGSTVVAQNDNWATATGDISGAAASVGAFPFTARSADAALLTTLAPGPYTVQVSGGTGVTLAEIYEVLESAEAPGTRRLANLSARGAVSPGAPLIAGFVITGTAPQRVLVRGTGPALAGAPFNVTGTLTNPVLTLFRGATVVKTNDDWFRDADVALISAAAAKVGAFALGAQSLDAALLVYLDPGAYTAQITGATNTNGTGSALVEIYEVAP